MLQRKVRVVGCFDSFLKAAKPIADMLADEGASVSYGLVLARLRQLSGAQRCAAGVPRLSPILPMSWVIRGLLQDRVDIVLVAMSGLRTMRMVRAVREAALARKVAPPLLVSLYPGLLLHMQLEGMMARSESDILLLNSKYDQALYREAVDALNRPDNSVLAGLQFLDWRERTNLGQGPHRVVFAAQPTIPSGLAERTMLLRELARAARAQPDATWIIKPRHRMRETTLHRVRFPYEKILRELPDRPRNLVIDYTPIAEQIETASALITISSTAVVEAVARGVPARVLTDVGLHEGLRNHFFLGSGLLCRIDDIGVGIRPTIDQGWRDMHLTRGDDLRLKLLSRVEELLEERKVSA